MLSSGSSNIIKLTEAAKGETLHRSCMPRHDMPSLQAKKRNYPIKYLITYLWIATSANKKQLKPARSIRASDCNCTDREHKKEARATRCIPKYIGRH
jgi:hypothetical protein